MSTHAELELAPAYALGALDEAERKTFEAHLQGCSECQAAVAATAPVVGALGYAAKPEPLPPGSGDKLVALLRAEKASGLFRPLPPSQPPSGSGGGAPAPRSGSTLVTAALAVVAAGMGVTAFLQKQAFDSQFTRAESLEASLSRAQEARHTADEALKKAEAELEHCRKHGAEIISLLSDPTLIKRFKPNGGFSGTTEVAFDATSGELVVAAGRLPALPPGKVYKLWAFVKGQAAPAPLGAFDPSRENMHFDTAPANAVSFAVSIENAPGNVTSPTEVVLLPG